MREAALRGVHRRGKGWKPFGVNTAMPSRRVSPEKGELRRADQENRHLISVRGFIATLDPTCEMQLAETSAVESTKAAFVRLL